MALMEEASHSRVTDFRERFRPQREWAEGRGLLLILAHFLTGTGAAGWLFSAFLDLELGLIVGFLLVALGAMAHLFFLGRPERFWRMITRFNSSWISRGFAGMTLFMIVAVAYLLLLFLGQHDGGPGKVVLAISLLAAIWIVLYKGFVWASSKGIPLWNTPLVPALYIAYALRAGAAVLMMLSALGTGDAALGFLEPIKLWLAISTAVLVFVYLEVMRGSGMTALRSVNVMLLGRVALPFYLGAALLGLVIPIVIGGFALTKAIPVELLGLAALFSLLGDLSIIYCIAKAGLYRPLPA
ncbi:MAG: polysulfide reductase NrfD [Deltaproteobacteria bacterium]|nr:polysulfide reductase NrfD [Deltaproteobacteria bacterium]